MTLSVIIPTLNEEEYIKETVLCLIRHCSQPLPEIIVVDTGSKDRTVEILGSMPVGVYVLPEFMGKKYEALNFGASKASGDILLFLDADTLLPANFDRLIKNAMTDHIAVGGSFEFAFRDGNGLLTLISWINRLRYRIWHQYYGDQGLFVKQTVFRAVGGYPERKLLESAYFCKALKKRGQLKLINAKVLTSARRFVEGGILRVFWMDFKVFFLDLMGFEVGAFAKAYWSENQTRAKKQYD